MAYDEAEVAPFTVLKTVGPLEEEDRAGRLGNGALRCSGPLLEEVQAFSR